MAESLKRMNFKDEIRRLEKLLRFSPSFMDQKVDPAEDFYRYSNGEWLRNNPVPADQPFVGAFYLLVERNLFILGDILEECGRNLGNSDDHNTRMLGAFYQSGMDQYTLEKKGFDPIMPYLRMIDSITDREGVINAAMDLLRNGLPSLFGIQVYPDLKNSSIYSLYIEQGGLSLPDRDYYLLPSFEETKKKLLDHMKRMFSLLSFTSELAELSANGVLAIEEKIAFISRPRQDLVDVEKNYNKFLMDEFKEHFPAFKISRLLGEDYSEPDYIIVGQPDFLDSLMKILTTEDLGMLKTYLKWRVINFASPFLHSRSESEYFRMFHSELMGVKEQEPRWKRVARLADELLGEALGELYVKREFPEEAERRMNVLVHDILDSFRERLENISWMSENTKSKAMEKLSSFRVKIGHTEKYRDYSSLNLNKNEFFGNILRCREFEMNRDFSRIGKEVDKNEWWMAPQAVNAYYNQTGNEIVFPAGILQPPFFDVTMDDAVNYGAIGSVISHEITHGFDDQGRKFDAQGNINDWWSESDSEEFSRRSSKLVELYSSLEAMPGLNVNGKLTLSENIADFGGISIAYDALKRRLNENNQYETLTDGFTQEQRFFISYSQIWRSNMTDQMIRLKASVDNHAPDSLRGSIPVIYHPKFPEVFKIDNEKAQGLRKIDVVPIW